MDEATGGGMLLHLGGVSLQWQLILTTGVGLIAILAVFLPL